MKMATSCSQNRVVQLLCFVNLSRMVENCLAGVSGPASMLGLQSSYVFILYVQ